MVAAAYAYLKKPLAIFTPSIEIRSYLDTMKRIAERSVNTFCGMLLFAKACEFVPSARSVLSNKTIQLTERYLALPLRAGRDALVGALPSMNMSFKYGLKLQTNWTGVVAGAFLEEIIFRSCLQSLLLREMPKFILHKATPAHEHLVDHKVAKIARVLCTSSAFALSHIVRLGDRPGMLLPQFLFGVYSSFLREQGTSIAELSCTHFAINAMVALVAGGMNTEPLRSY